MICKEAINRYMALDKHEPVPLALTIHLLRCKQCRKVVRAMTMAANLYSQTTTTKKNYDNDLTKKTMKKINTVIPDFNRIQAEKNSLPEVKIFPWAIVGLIMILGLASIPFTTLGKWASESFRLNFIIPFALIFAIFVSIYCTMFVGRNLDFFIKKFDLTQDRF